ncbi:MAG: helix-turn-helix domain-containing protein, partial [Candidatus Methanomethylophilus sp.]|nr:helix-turn-helix domain-containing protein [Methanomethylophilus sp.]
MNNMNDLDSLLSIIENPTRRKILQAVVREPHYPLQLSKELGISQQAVVKNLNLMEKEGLLVSYRRSSDRGPERIFYKPSSEFTIIIDMRDNMF